MNGLNPLLTTDPQSTTASWRIYAAPLGYDPRTGEPSPHLAESWAVSPDNTSITFTMRDNLTWSDGSPLTVDDMWFTLEALVRSQSAPRKATIAGEIVGAQDYADGKTQQIAGVSTSGRTLTVQLTGPLCTAATDIGELPILPRSVFGKYMDPADPSKTIDDARENNAPPLASGPFRFQEWVPRDHVTLVRNDHFYLGPPKLDEWVYRVIPNPTAIAAALKTGEIDVAQLLGRVDDLKATSSLNVYSIPGTGYTYIAWNELRGGKEFFADKTVRQALAYGLDWNQIIATLAGGEAVRVVAHTPPTSWAYDPTGLNDYAYNPPKARQLLEDDGWKSGPDGIYQKGGQRLAFTLLTHPESPLRVGIVQVAAEQYRQIGVEVTPQTEAFNAFLQRTISSRDPTYGDQGGRDFDAYVIGYGQIGPDPDAYLYWHSSELLTGLNRVGYRSVATDRAVERGRASCDPADRKAAYHQMDLQLNEDQPVNFGFVTTTQLVVSKAIQGVEPGPYTFLAQWNVEQWSRSH
ncbi:MAG TPA: ABC transporter substrate-binding protein [Chloroflexota bacterium]|nr:ABC transporter substrate-binding protein [Chloroflexota bacterium]